MVMGGLELYNVSCTKCDWQEDVTVKKELGGILSNLLKPQIPKKCPECKSKTKHHKKIGELF